MRLYEFAPTRSIRVRWTLQELGVDFEAETVDIGKGENHDPEFLAINPAGKVPALVDGDRVLTESVAIVVYLADKFPEKKLLPVDPGERAEAHRWLMFTVTELEQPLWRIAHHQNLYPPEKRIPAEIELAKGDFIAMAPVLETHMKGREFVVGEHVSVADFVLAYTLDWANEVGLLKSFPVLESYMERMLARPKAPPRIKSALASIQAA